MQDLEGRCKGQEQQLAQLEQRIKVLERENVMLRQVIKNMQVCSRQASSEQMYPKLLPLIPVLATVLFTILVL